MTCLSIDNPSTNRIPCASLLLSLAAALIFVCPSLAARLEYNRAAIAAGEIWRLFSGHWVHYGFDHFFWDVLAFGFLGAACERRDRPRFLVCVTASALAISLSVWFGLSGMSAYRGLSGIDSALVVLLFMELWSEAGRLGQPKQIVIPAACLIAFVCKVSYELATGDTIFVRSLGSGMVGVPLAHVAGAAVGFLVGLGTPGTRRPVLTWLKAAPAPERCELPVLGRIAAAPGEWVRTAR
jgi:rhomboid family GlyGly-CTERM serine protease